MSVSIGLSKGVGKLEGRKEGLEVGKEALLQTARNPLSMKLPLESIAKATGLSFEEIQKLSV
ncbi:MAG: hypothetical protein WA705_10155 [Candidatus Ozemobacteraceae bacterium]